MTADTNAKGSTASTRHRIVVGVDGSEHSIAALEWAAAQAQRSGVVLEIVSASVPGNQYLSRSEVEQCLQSNVDEATRRAQKLAPGVDITSATLAVPPEAVLIKESAGADLLVVGSRGLGGFTGLLLGSVSRKCVHRAKCPVVVVSKHETGSHAVRDQTETSVQDSSAHRIVVGVDGSPTSIAALEWAANQAELTGATLDVLMTWEWPYGYGWSPEPADYDPEHECESALSDLVKSIREARPSVSIQETAIEGHPSPSLVKASQGADLLVVGSRGHGDFVGMLLGSVSEHCVTSAHCPVLVLRDGQ